MYGYWYEWLGLGGLVLVILYFGMWIARIRGAVKREENNE